MGNIRTFDGKLSGDGECFCFKVSTQEYIKLFGTDRYLAEVAYRRELHDDFKADDEERFIEPTEWEVYPSQLVDYKQNVIYKITFSISEK